MPAPSPHEMICPNCRAKQRWSDECRRCKSDLTLLRLAAEQFFTWRHECLAALREARWEAALRAAQQAFALCPDSDARRWTAVCHAHLGHWSLALELLGQQPLVR